MNIYDRTFMRLAVILFAAAGFFICTPFGIILLGYLRGRLVNLAEISFTNMFVAAITISLIFILLGATFLLLALNRGVVEKVNKNSVS